MAFLEKHVSKPILSRVTTWMEDHAILSVSLPALLPPPMPLSPFVLAAGAVHMSRKKFMWAFTISRFIRHCIAIWIGVRYGHAFLRLWSHFSDKWAATILIIIWTTILPRSPSPSGSSSAPPASSTSPPATLAHPPARRHPHPLTTSLYAAATAPGFTRGANFRL